EIKRELEQIATLRSTQILQENLNWTEEKFLEELRKCLPEGVSHDLSYEDTWNEIAKIYQFINQNRERKELSQGYRTITSTTLIRSEGMILMMNKNGDLMANSKRVVMKDVSGLIEENVIANKESNFSKNITQEDINGKKVDKIIKYTLIQRDVNAPADAYQKLLNAVGEAYISKRNEIARHYYQTDYKALDAAGKNLVNDVVPILVMCANPRDMKMKQERGKISVIYSDSPNFNLKFSSDNDKMPTEEEWKKAEAEFEKINTRQITYNGQTITVKDLYELLEKDTDGKAGMGYRYEYDKGTRESECKVSIRAPAIDPKDPAYYYLLGGKWVYSLGISAGLVQAINVYSPDDAVRKYGSKAKNGAISIISLPPRL
ncbi:MAG: hypothetical protein LBL24_04695, partial [Bacteroidales bacterium]|nr:hypothetical protein [Bacteroidales bacterium]